MIPSEIKVLKTSKRNNYPKPKTNPTPYEIKVGGLVKITQQAKRTQSRNPKNLNTKSSNIF